MFTICSVKVENMENGCVTDVQPNISFALASDMPGEALQEAEIAVGAWSVKTTDQVNNIYTGPLEPFTNYTVQVTAKGVHGEQAEAQASFQTGRLGMPWQGKWITDLSYEYPEKQSPVPMVFRRGFAVKGGLRRAWINATALGIYELQLNGEKVGKDYFAPGYTSYRHQIQYQTYDVTEMLREENQLLATVAGGWAAGAFGMARKNKLDADRQALLCEIWLEYADGTRQVIASDESWETTLEGNTRFAEWYDGEVFDATLDLAAARWRQAQQTSPRGKPEIVAQYGEPVRVMETLKPQSVVKAPSGEYIYDFGQNFAGVICAQIKGHAEQKIVFRHAEVLVGDELFVKSLRTAKATATYICREGAQQYSPRFTYMGFRYAGVSGIEPEDIQLSGLVLYSRMDAAGSFACSNELVNRLQSNIVWGGKSNFVDIPTDCPQRDERLGWTGDISVFAGTACYNFDMSRFLDKWLRDMRAEQGKGGGIPMVIPKAVDNWPVFANACWGDSCILVPWAEYMARGNKRLLEEHYPSMKRFMQAVKWWAAFLSAGPNKKHIWGLPFHWGDWCAPKGAARDWILRGKWVATAYYANSCRLMAQIAQLLGKQQDAQYYRALNAKINKAFRKVFTDGKGKLKKEFQTGYVLPLYFGMTEGEETKAMVGHLAGLVRQAGNHLGTGFPGTPYLLFALSDNGHQQEAFDLLLQDTCPSWLYEVKAGGTTIWERWDSLRPDGTVNIAELSGGKADEESSGGMVSFNHYAGGAVGDWLYRRVAGIEATSGGYKTFQIAPLVGGGLHFARGAVQTPYGKIVSDWKIEGGTFTIQVKVPVSTQCVLTLPNGETHSLGSGSYVYGCRV